MDIDTEGIRTLAGRAQWISSTVRVDFTNQVPGARQRLAFIFQSIPV